MAWSVVQWREEKKIPKDVFCSVPVSAAGTWGLANKFASRKQCTFWPSNSNGNGNGNGNSQQSGRRVKQTSSMFGCGIVGLARQLHIS
jgi:hypothetical protein